MTDQSPPAAPSGARGLARRKASARAVPVAGAVLALFLGACAGGPAPDTGPRVDASEVASAAERATRVEAPYRLVFRWELREPDLRTDGRGVVRIEPPYRVRLDLFTSGGETAASAALVDHDLRIPEGAREELIPPPALLWGALGVFHPQPGMALLRGAATGDDGFRLEYRGAGGGELTFAVQAGDRVREVELRQGGRVVQRVDVSGEREGPFPREARYRHMADTRELRLTLESVEHVESYPDDIWSPNR